MRTIEMSNCLKLICVEPSYWRTILLCLLCTSCSLSGANGFLDDAHMDHGSHDNCPNFSGTYKLYGEALPGMPPYFRFRSRGLALDVMLGLDINLPERWPTSDIQVVQTDPHTISVRIVGSSVTKTMELQSGDKVWCKDHRLTIESLRETKGEATTGRALIIDQLELAQDGALIVRTEIRDRSTFLFFDVSSPPEFYGARFQVVR
jgi:hypothetical protein